MRGNTLPNAGLIRKWGIKVGRVLRRAPPPRWAGSTPNPVLEAALGEWATASSDIRDHLGTIFYEAASSRPRLMVELGTRQGVSTRALLAAAEVCDAHVLSIDLADCSGIDLPERFRRRWSFTRAEDVAFAGQGLADFCAARGLPPRAEVILVDTSHDYEHTRAEIAAWGPRLAPGGVLLFHDSNMGTGWYRRLDGKAEPGWNNERGVMRAIEEFLGRHFDEHTFFAGQADGFAVHHVPWSNGFTVLRKLG